MMMYKPKPMDTTGIKLPEEITQLVEELASNAHEIWALQRINEGWTKGEKRDDVLMKHPCLVPYKELPESEKEYDRKISMETLKTIVAMGFVINRK